MIKRTVFFVISSFIAVSTIQAQNLVGLGGGQEYSYDKLVIKSPLFSSGYLLAEDSIKYPLKLVWYYQIDGDYYRRRVLNNGSYEFIHREVEGAIELYSALRTTTTFNPYTGVPTTTTGKVNFYSKKGKAFKKVKGKNLMEDLSDCKPCMEEIKKTKTLNLISAIGLSAGLGIFIGTAVTNLSEKPEPGESSSIPAGVFIGPALCFTPWILSGPKRKHYSNAIEIYNERE